MKANNAGEMCLFSILCTISLYAYLGTEVQLGHHLRYIEAKQCSTFVMTFECTAVYGVFTSQLSVPDNHLRSFLIRLIVDTTIPILTTGHFSSLKRHYSLHYLLGMINSGVQIRTPLTPKIPVIPSKETCQFTEILLINSQV